MQNRSSIVNMTWKSLVLMGAIGLVLEGCFPIGKSWQRVAVEKVYEQLQTMEDEQERSLARDYIRSLLSLERGGDPDKAFGEGKKTLLMMAIIRGDEEIVGRLLSLDIYANVNCSDDDGNTPLIFACERGGDVDIVRRLIKEGAQVNWQNKNGMTALMASALSGDEAIAECLIAAGSDSTMKDNANRNWMDYAISKGRLDFTTRFNNSKKEGTK